MLRLAWAVLATSIAASAQLTIQEAVRVASEEHPRVRQSMERAAAALAEIRLARTSYLPQANLLGQVNRATHNNVFGLLETQPVPVISTITGPVQGTNSGASVWGSAVGALVAWEPFDFGLRRANVLSAQATGTRANAEIAVSKLQAAAAAADAFLTIEAAQQTVEAARAGVERSRVLNEVVGALARNQLRPGAEASRATAELAGEQTYLIEAEQNVAVATAALAAILAKPIDAIAAGPFLTRLPADNATPAAPHPATLLQRAAVDEVKAREYALSRQYFPKFTLEANSFARGTGLSSDGHIGSGASGLGPDFQNWALGLNITLPLFEIAAIHARQEIETHNERAAAAGYQDVVQQINGEVAQARARLDGARRIAANTPIQLDAARTTERQATARYKAGLGTISDVAEAQRLLTQSEIDNSLARLGVWRALLHLAIAQGDLTPFLEEAAR